MPGAAGPTRWADSIMTRVFHSFVILGAMRTGSNYLEASLNEIDGITSYGEVFNPHFIGRQGQDAMLGVTMERREQKPAMLLRRMHKKTEGLSGFRFFQGHDPRAFKAVMDDPDCAKIVLSRNPVESFVSLGIASKTGQWLLRSEKQRKIAKIHFDQAQFESYFEELFAFYSDVRRHLQTSGQTAFQIDYDDLSDVKVLNGLAKWLGVEGRLKKASAKLIRQNPVALADKVLNPEDAAQALNRLELMNPGLGLWNDPRRGPAVPTYVAAAKAPLLFLPIKGGPIETVEGWMAAFGKGDLIRDFNRDKLRDWRAQRFDYRSFTVLSHPLARAHRAFCQYILATTPQSYLGIRGQLIQNLGLPLPETIDDTYTRKAHRTAFLAYLDFVKANLAGRTSIRVDGAWASQQTIVQGFSTFNPPDMLIREDRLKEGLSQIAMQIGQKPPAIPADTATEGPFTLADIYDEEVEAACRAAYARDYDAFGFTDWGWIKQP